MRPEGLCGFVPILPACLYLPLSVTPGVSKTFWTFPMCLEYNAPSGNLSVHVPVCLNNNKNQPFLYSFLKTEQDYFIGTIT